MKEKGNSLIIEADQQNNENNENKPDYSGFDFKKSIENTIQAALILTGGWSISFLNHMTCTHLNADGI